MAANWRVCQEWWKPRDGLLRCIQNESCPVENRAVTNDCYLPFQRVSQSEHIATTMKITTFRRQYVVKKALFFAFINLAVL